MILHVSCQIARAAKGQYSCNSSGQGQKSTSDSYRLIALALLKMLAKDKLRFATFAQLRKGERF
jgi:hypothetical protein